MAVSVALSATIRLPGSDGVLLDIWLPFGFLGLVGWSVWVARRVLTSRYRPWAGTHSEPASVVAPCFREAPEIVVLAARSWLAAGANEVILVFPRDELYNMARARASFAGIPAVRVVHTDNAEKRFMLAAGIRRARHEIVVLSDSDTLWERECLRNLLLPFASRSTGGVGTRQRVLDVESSVWRRAADWCLDAKYLTYLPAMSRAGGVSCLSGRTAAYRRHILLDVLDELTGETFFGRRCISGDDGRLTWLVLRRGYATTYQRNAVAWTVMPGGARDFFRQRTRWARNSYRCYLRAIGRGWLFEQPMITRVSVLQGLIAPLSLTVGFVFVALAIARDSWAAVALWAAWIMTGRAIRGYDHLRERPADIVLLPMMTAVLLFAMTPVKFWSLVTMNRQAWLTREAVPVLAPSAAEAPEEPVRAQRGFVEPQPRFADGDA
jgi:hyaluronan synthase